MPDVKTVQVRAGTHKKLKQIKAHRRWSLTESIDVMADRELEAIKREKAEQAPANVTKD